MSKLKVDDVLFAYITVASHAISLVLVRVDSGMQRLVYYVRKSLHEIEVLSTIEEGHFGSGACYT